MYHNTPHALLVALLLVACGKRSAQPLVVESPEERARILTAGFATEQAPTELTYVADQVLTDLRKALAAGDMVAADAIFDLELVLQRAGDSDGVAKLAARLDSTSVRRKLLAGVGLGWETHVVRHVVPIATEPRELMVMVVQRDADGIPLRVRWWLVETDPGVWKVYDYEEVDNAERLTTMFAVTLGSGEDTIDVWLPHHKRMQAELIPAVENEDFAAARRAIDQIDPSVLPGFLRAKALRLRAHVEAAEGQPEVALATNRLAAAAHPLAVDMPAILEHELELLVDLERYDEALAVADRLAARYGEDEWALDVRGRALLGLGRQSEAAEVFRRGLVHHADHVGCLDGLISTGQADTAELARLVGRARPEVIFDTLGAHYSEHGDAGGLAALIAALEATPDHAAQRSRIDQLKQELTRLRAEVTVPSEWGGVMLVGHGAKIELLDGAVVAPIVGEAREPWSEPWDLVVTSTGSGERVSVRVEARPGQQPELIEMGSSPTAAGMASAGIAEVARRSDAEPWKVITRTAELPWVELPMVSVHHKDQAGRLAIDFMTSVYLSDEEPFPGAKETLLGIVGPLDEPFAVGDATRPEQTLVASDLDASPRWIENASTRDGIAWRQRVYWSVTGHFVVSYDVPADRPLESALLRRAAERIAREIRVRE